MNKMDAVQQLVRSPLMGLVTLAFAGAFVYGFLIGLITTDSFIAMAGPIIGFWFRDRDGQRREDRDNGVLPPRR